MSYRAAWPRRVGGRRRYPHPGSTNTSIFKPISAEAAKSSRFASPLYQSEPDESRSLRVRKNFFDRPHLHREDKGFKLSPEVDDALYNRKPVVALETTIYTHGFPYPDNVALALDLESIVRRNGGVPATIGILEGVARVGMSTEELRRITASAGKPETMKVSRRDLPYILGLVSHPHVTIKRQASSLVLSRFRNSSNSISRELLAANSMEVLRSLVQCS